MKKIKSPRPVMRRTSMIATPTTTSSPSVVTTSTTTANVHSAPAALGRNGNNKTECITDATNTPVKTYRQRSGSLDDAVFVFRRKSTVEKETPFEMHLRDVYAGIADEDAGLEFFESHGYYDVSEANTVEMFRQNFKLDAFWDEELPHLIRKSDRIHQYPSRSSYFFSSVEYYSSTTATDPSDRFELLDEDEDDGLEREMQLELAREERMKAQNMELDEDDVAELEREQQVVVQAIQVIRTEKIRFKRYFFQAFNDNSAHSPSTNWSPPAQHQIVPPTHNPISIQLPPYSGWHKRWFYLDFNAGVVMMYKRSYWKSPRGVLDLRTVAKVLHMNDCDIRIELFDQVATKTTMLLRTKVAEEAELWVNLLQFARRQVRSFVPPAAALLQSHTIQCAMSPTMSTELSVSRASDTTTTKKKRDLLHLLLRPSSSSARRRRQTTSSTNTLTAA